LLTTVVVVFLYLLMDKTVRCPAEHVVGLSGCGPVSLPRARIRSSDAFTDVLHFWHFARLKKKSARFLVRGAQVGQRVEIPQRGTAFRRWRRGTGIMSGRSNPGDTNGPRHALPRLLDPAAPREAHAPGGRLELPTGAERRYPVLQVGLTVGVVPFVDRSTSFSFEQFRHLARETSWELPGGGGQPASRRAAAQRELPRRGRSSGGRLLFLTRFYPSNAYLDETAHCFVGLDLTPDPSPPMTTSSSSRRVSLSGTRWPWPWTIAITESVSKVALLAAALRPDLLP